MIIINHLDYPVRYAAWFAKKQAAAASGLARAARFHVMPVDTEDLQKLARSLAQGVIKAGELSLSIVDEEIASELDALARAQADAGCTVESAERMAEGGLADTSVDAQFSEASASNLWDELQAGALVLAAELDRQGAPECWYEAIIVRAEGSEFTLRWRDFPREGLLTRTRRHIAILHPAN